MNTKQASEQLNINQNWIRIQIRKGTIKAEKTFHGYDISEDEVEKYRRENLRGDEVKRYRGKNLRGVAK